jgi:hypothetical protein
MTAPRRFEFEHVPVNAPPNSCRDCPQPTTRVQCDVVRVLAAQVGILFAEQMGPAGLEVVVKDVYENTAGAGKSRHHVLCRPHA